MTEPLGPTRRNRTARQSPLTPPRVSRVVSVVGTKRGPNAPTAILAGFRALLPGSGFAWRRHALILAEELNQARHERAIARGLLVEAREMLHVPEEVSASDQWERHVRDWRIRVARWLS